MTVQNWIELIISILAIFLAVISASLAYFFAKKKQILLDESRIKEKYYLNYIQAISELVVTNNSDEARNKLADAQNQLLLVGSSDVVSKLMIFHDYLILSKKQDNFDVVCHDILLSELIKAMRKDLYKKRKVNEKYPQIHLTGVNSIK